MAFAQGTIVQMPTMPVADDNNNQTKCTLMMSSLHAEQAVALPMTTQSINMTNANYDRTMVGVSTPHYTPPAWSCNLMQAMATRLTQDSKASNVTDSRARRWLDIGLFLPDGF
eukprot:611107-Amphidinium_carterae.1